MQIKIKATNAQLSKSLSDLIEKKVNSLERFIPRDLISRSLNGRKSTVMAVIEIGRPSRHHRKDSIYYAEIQILLPKRRLRAESKNWSLSLAINEAKNELQRQLTKDKQVAASRIKRNKRAVRRLARA